MRTSGEIPYRSGKIRKIIEKREQHASLLITVSSFHFNHCFFHLQEESLDLVVRNLQITYFATYGYRFPLTGNFGTGGIELMPRLKPIIRSAFYFERVNVAEAFCIVVCL